MTGKGIKILRYFLEVKNQVKKHCYIKVLETL